MEDTSPEISDKICEIMQKKTPGERLKMGLSMIRASRYLITRFILQENPYISELELKKELFLKFYANDFAVSEQEKIFAHFEKVSVLKK